MAHKETINGRNAAWVFTQEEQDILFDEFVNKQTSLQDIQKDHFPSVPYQAVYHYIKINKIYDIFDEKWFTPEKVDRIKAEYVTCSSSKELAESLGINFNHLTRFVRKLGIVRHPKAQTAPNPYDEDDDGLEPFSFLYEIMDNDKSPGNDYYGTVKVYPKRGSKKTIREDRINAEAIRKAKMIFPHLDKLNWSLYRVEYDKAYKERRTFIHEESKKTKR